MLTVVTNRKDCVSPFYNQIEKILSAKPDRLILREKDLSPLEYKMYATRVCKLCFEYDVKFVVNSFLSVAKDLNVSDVQLPFNLFVEKLDVCADMNVGVSVHNLDEAIRAEQLDADSLIFGNIFDTCCKPGKKGCGISEIKKICDCVTIPVHAIGGINTENISELKRSNIDNICIMSSAMKTNNPRKLFSELV